MASPENRNYESQIWRSIILGFLILVILASVPILLTSASLAYEPPKSYTGSINTSCQSPFSPLFTPPADKLLITADPSFTRQLFAEATAYEPLINATGTQVHMGFWSGRGNHGSLVVLLDAINDRPVTSNSIKNRAIWDEGVTSSTQYPSYVTMNQEHWYERADSTNGTAIIYGRAFPDPYPVTLAQADDIWGQYSQRYVDMAELISPATGNPVDVWCFVEGARAGRVFYKYELPELQKLEERGIVRVHFAKFRTANWTRPEDWITGTANAPVPAG